MSKKRAVFGTFCAAFLQILGVFLITDLPVIRLLPVPGILWFLAVAAYFWAVFFPLPGLKAPKKLRQLARGRFLLRCFAWLALFNLLLSIACFFSPYQLWWYWLIQLFASQLLLFPVLFSGMLRAALSSVQLGIWRRALLLMFWWMPGFNFALALAAAKKIGREYLEEWDREELEQVRAESAVCATRYPILMVHGVFFRDLHYFNYWGRIPTALKRNGAAIYYGEQPSADTVADCGSILRRRILQILEETGSEKVNIIAHSKGGLDARYCISMLGMGDRVASLTTVNTPHNGCAYADVLLKKVPERVRQQIARRYNSTLAKFGEQDADFLGAINDLTVENCTAFNELAADDPRVYYQSIGSRMKNGRSAPFPVSWSYHLVKAFSNENDGLVDTASQHWGENFRMLEPAGKRGISHGDMIDLWRQNIPGFDVREFYVDLVSELKNKGF
ncbi:MAG: triacylglycerol lipase [Clostridia bacterium]|nr:triacylglycerol lipase [Clostridia bacterium]